MHAVSIAQASFPIRSVVGPYLSVFFVALVVSLILTPLMRWLAVRNGVVDRPDLIRKHHGRVTAYLGGAAIFLAWLAGMCACFFIVPHDPRVLALGTTHVAFPISIVIGALVITLTGLMDDVFGISPRVKVGGQLFAAAALAHNDVGFALVEDLIKFFGYQPPETFCYVAGATLIAVFVLGGCNAMNLMDGMDGLAGGVTFIAAVGLLFLSVFTAVGLTGPADAPPGIDILTSPVRIVMCLAIMGAILGFLLFNFYPASIFMGDAGSLLLGYLSISTILLLAHAPASGPALVMAALIVFALPIVDTMLAIVRRKVAGRPIFEPDKHHMHHELQARGLNVPQATLVMYLLAAFFAAAGCSIVFLRGRYVVAIFAAFYTLTPLIAFIHGKRRKARLAADAASVPAEDALPFRGTPARRRRRYRDHLKRVRGKV